MAYTQYTVLANSQNYGGSRSASKIKYIVYHYTANKTDKAKSNANYFKNNVVKASAHYFVDDTSVYQSVPDLKIAWAVGGKKYSDCNSTGGGTMYGKITNTNSISIEMCSTNGVITDKTIENAVALGKKLMKAYNIPSSNIYRHTDVNGKHCPGWKGWLGSDTSKWKSFKKKFSTSTKISSTTSKTNTTTKEFKVKVLVDDLRIRKGAGTNYDSVGKVKKGVTYTITQTSGLWGKLKSGTGWICISEKYVKKV